MKIQLYTRQNVCIHSSAASPAPHPHRPLKGNFFSKVQKYIPFHKFREWSVVKDRFPCTADFKYIIEQKGDFYTGCNRFRNDLLGET